MERLKHPDLERYLARATRGLWGPLKGRVAQELRGGIEEAARDLRLAGHSEPEALAEALRRFGPAGRVNRGLLRVHAAPAAARLLVIAALAAALVPPARLALDATGGNQPAARLTPMLLAKPCRVAVGAVPRPIPPAVRGGAAVRPLPLARPGDAVACPLPVAEPDGAGRMP